MLDASLLELRKFVIPEFIFGEGARNLAGRQARNLGAQKVLVVTDNGLLQASWTQDVISRLKEAGLRCALFSDVSSNPRETEVMAGAELYAREGCDALIAIGGGSPMDCAKGIGVVASNKRHILEFEGVDKVEHPGPPLICTPTTAGSSADVSQFAIINDTTRKLKIAIVSKAMVPDTALIDPVVTTTMDAELTAYTGLDALTHAIEAYGSNAHSPVTDLHALEAIRLVAKHLHAATTRPNDLKIRAGMMLGSMYAGFAFSNAILGATHAMSHSLGGLLDLPHGLCNAILLEHVTAYNFRAAPARYKAVARALGADVADNAPDDEALALLLDALEALKTKVGITANLSDLGVRPEDLDKLAAHAMQDACMLTNPRQADIEDIKTIFRSAS